MPKTKFQNVVFTLMMSFLMVYAMICYNISMNIGGMTNQVFLMAFHEMIIMWPAAFILEFFLVDHLAHKLAFCMVTPQDRPIVITLAISIMIIAIMCPIMSFIATLLFKNAGKEFVAVSSPRVDVIQGNTIALFFLVMAAGGYGRPCERTVTLRGKPAGEGRPGRKMRARAASPFPEPFMQYKETPMNTRGFSLVREERLSEVSGTVKLWRHDATGAELLSIVNNDENKCFGATFRTSFFSDSTIFFTSCVRARSATSTLSAVSTTTRSDTPSAATIRLEACR